MLTSRASKFAQMQGMRIRLICAGLGRELLGCGRQREPDIARGQRRRTELDAAAKIVILRPRGHAAPNRTPQLGRPLADGCDSATSRNGMQQ